MALDAPSIGPEKFEYRTWWQDPEQVENLVTLLEAKTTDDETKEEHWKYGTGRIYAWMFPKVRQEAVPRYGRAPTPTKDEFMTNVSLLRAGRLRLGRAVPKELQERFAAVAEARYADEDLHNAEREAEWTKAEKIIVAGLFVYCGFRFSDIARMLSDFDIRISGNSLAVRFEYLKKVEKFPYDTEVPLEENTARMKFFVDALQTKTGLSLEGLREFASQELQPRNLKKLDAFIERYRQLSAGGTE